MGQRTLPVDELPQELGSFSPIKLEQSSAPLFDLFDRVFVCAIRQRLSCVSQPSEFLPLGRLVATRSTRIFIRRPRSIPHGELVAVEQLIAYKRGQVMLNVRTASQRRTIVVSQERHTECHIRQNPPVRTHSRFRRPGLRLPRKRTRTPSNMSSGRSATGSLRHLSKLSNAYKLSRK